MASGCFTIAIDVSFSRDVLDMSGIYYQNNTLVLAEKMQWTLTNQYNLESYKTAARERIRERYSWDAVTDDYERMFYEMIGK